MCAVSTAQPRSGRNRLAREHAARHRASVRTQSDSARESPPLPDWEDLYQTWELSAREYPEVSNLAKFTEIEWPGDRYWVPARPTDVSGGADPRWVDWWPRAEAESRVEFLAKRTSYGTWPSAFAHLPDACRYTLRFAWEARHDPQLTAAVWLGATMIMWESHTHERTGWSGDTSQMCNFVRYRCYERMERNLIGTWLHGCKYPLPETIGRFIRAPRTLYELVQMAAANAAFIHNRWTLVQLRSVRKPRRPRATASKPTANSIRG